MTGLPPQLEQINFKDPRVQKRLRRVLAWCSVHLSFDRPREIWSKSLTKVFGTTSTGKLKETERLGALLKSALLIRTMNYRVTDEKKGQVGFPCEYILNRSAFEFFKSKLEGKMSIADAVPEHKAELELLEFEYTEKSDRYWHCLQNIKRESKKEFWTTFGLKHNYDIAACAPTLLLQMAKRNGIRPIVAEPIEKYLADREALREHVAQLTGLSIDDAKQLINSFFNGATLAKTSFCTAYREHGAFVVEKLQKDWEVRRLRVSIKALWMCIRRGTETAEVERLKGLKVSVRKERRVRRSKDKWAIYFKEERRVMDTIKNYLAVRGVKHFTEHDGFRTNRPVNLRELEQEIKEKTVYDLRIEED